MRYALLAAALCALVGAAWLIFGKPAADAPEEKRFELVIERGQIVSGETTLRVQQNDTVTITISADEAEEFHLHGYDRSVDLSPGATHKLSFTANIAGRFEFELEKQKRELGALEVLP